MVDDGMYTDGKDMHCTGVIRTSAENCDTGVRTRRELKDNCTALWQ